MRVPLCAVQSMRGSAGKTGAKASRVRVSPLSNSDAKWIELKRIDWIDEHSKERRWETVERTKRGKTGVDAVAIFPRLYSKGQPDRTILVKQYRPPLDSYTLENPAGLVDEGDSLEQAALRELREETGYIGTRVTQVTRAIYCDPVEKECVCVCVRVRV